MPLRVSVTLCLSCLWCFSIKLSVSGFSAQFHSRSIAMAAHPTHDRLSNGKHTNNATHMCRMAGSRVRRPSIRPHGRLIRHRVVELTVAIQAGRTGTARAHKLVVLHVEPQPALLVNRRHVRDVQLVGSEQCSALRAPIRTLLLDTMITWSRSTGVRGPSNVSQYVSLHTHTRPAGNWRMSHGTAAHATNTIAMVKHTHTNNPTHEE